MPDEIELRLYRDSLTTPWGFRLHGGKDLSTPLTIQRVSAGTPSDGELLSGDVILQIQGSDASRLTHNQAQEHIRKSGGSLLLRIVRYGHPVRTLRSVVAVPQQEAAPWKKPTSQDYGIDFARSKGKIPIPVLAQPTPQPGFMLSRVKDTLSGVAGGDYPTGYPSYQNYERNITPTRLNLSPSFKPPSYAPPPPSLEPEEPAWAGSLRSSSRPLSSDTPPGHYPHSPRVQTVHYAPGEAPQYRQNTPGLKHDSETVRAAHLQYNSPLGLYSKATAQEALFTQLHGKPGEGTLQILSESDVYRSNAEADYRKPPTTGSLYAQQPETQYGAGDDSNIGQSDF